MRPRLAEWSEGASSETFDSEEASEVDRNDEDEDATDGSAEESDTASKDDVQEKIRQTSFGTLKQAQDVLSRKRKLGSSTSAEQEGKLEALRQRLRELKEEPSKETRPRKMPTPQESTERVARRGPSDSKASDDDSDSGPSEEEAEFKSRSSKHAPASQSSKRQVTRKRNVIDAPKRKSRDPRFEALHQDTTPIGHMDRAYSFLTEYQKSDIKELKSALKATRDEDDREKLKRKIGSMENRIKSKEAKDREQEIIRSHRKAEREKLQSGKLPYYLKHKDVKERALGEKFKSMSGKEREKVMERRKRRDEQKEKKRMPSSRRLVG